MLSCLLERLKEGYTVQEAVDVVSSTPGIREFIVLPALTRLMKEGHDVTSLHKAKQVVTLTEDTTVLKYLTTLSGSEYQNLLNAIKNGGLI